MKTPYWSFALLFSACVSNPPEESAPTFNLEDAEFRSLPSGVPYWARSNIVKTAAGGTTLDGNGLASDPSVIYDAGKYRMWFTHAKYPLTGDPNYPLIGYTESTDRINWTPPTLGVLDVTPNGWDSVGVETASVLRDPYDPAALIMFYTGDRPSYGGAYMGIGVAYSTNNGATWEKYPWPVLEEENSWEMTVTNPDVPGSIVGGVLEPSVIYEDELFKMWYAGMGILEGQPLGYEWGFRIGYATSPDGINWNRYILPVLEPGPPGSWDDKLVSHVNVIKDGDTYRMFYFGSSAADEEYCSYFANGCAQMPGSIGMATSTNGVTWTKDANNPILMTRPTGNFDDHAVGGPSALDIAGQLFLWYMGDGEAEQLKMRIGSAKVVGRAQIGESAHLSLDSTTSNDWRQVNLSRSYTSPVIIIGAPSRCDAGDPPTFRLKDITATSFKIKLDEWSHLDDIHCAESVDYLVVEEGNHILLDGRRLIAKKLSAGTSWVTSSFGSTFASEPAVFSQIQSNNDTAEVISRQNNRTTTSIQFTLQEAQGADGAHLNETLGYIAIGVGSGNYATTAHGLEVICPTSNLTHTLTPYNFKKLFFGTSTPLIFGAMQTTNDTDPAVVRRSVLSSVSVSMQAAEEKSASTNITHSAETFCYFAIDYFGAPSVIYKQQ